MTKTNQSKNNLILISLVAIVAIVGLFLMFSNNRINSTNIDEITNSVKFPETIPDKVNEIISYLYKNQSSGGFAISDQEIYIFGIDDDELELVMRYAEGKGLLKIDPKFASGGGLFSLEANGIDLAEELLKRKITAKKEGEQKIYNISCIS